MNAPTTPEASGKFVIGLLLGLAGTCLLGAVMGVPAGYAIVQASKQSERNRGWNLKPVVVYAVDVKAGTPVTFDMISQRSIPQQFANEMIVTPDSASYVINQQVGASVEAGDPVRWVDFIPAEARHCFPQ